METQRTMHTGPANTVDETHHHAARLGFIGGGNMGTAIIGGLVRSGHPADRIAVADPDTARLAALAASYGVTTAVAAQDAIAGADLVVLAVKPQQALCVLQTLRPTLVAERPVLLSIAAGLTVSALARHSGLSSGILRAMPNLPATVGAGISGLFGGQATEPGRTLGEYVLHAVGDVVWLQEEAQFDALTALSGSGPAYFYALAEAMSAAGTTLGLPKPLADALARKTLEGAGALLAHQEADPATLRAQVTSKGGTTAAALEILQGDTGLGTLIQAAMQAAASRSAALGTLLEEA